MVALLLGGLVGAGVAVGAEQEQPKEAERPILYRRVYVPASEISRFGGPYLPIGRKEFQQRIELLQRRQAAQGRQLEAGITRAVYSARLVDDQLVAGTAELSIVHQAEGPVAVPLEPCNLAVEAASWTPSDARAPNGQTARPPPAVPLGRDSLGKTVVVVPGSGTLRFGWSLRGRRESSGGVALDVRLPSCPMNRFVLDVPKGWEPAVSGGFVSRLAESPPDDGYARWSIDRMGSASDTLYITPQGAPRSIEQLVLLRQHATYRFSVKGIEISVDLNLDVHHQPLDRLSLTLDPSLRLVAAASGQSQLGWTENETAEGREIVLEFPEPITGIGRLVRLQALAPPADGARVRLPGIVPHEDDVLWLEGTAELVVLRPLVLDSLTAVGARQAAAATLVAPERGERVQVQYFRPQAEIDLLVGRREGSVVARQGTTIRLGSRSTTAVQVSDLASTGGQRFLLQMETSPEWTIDLVETVPPDRIDQWIPGRGNGVNRLVQIHLREPLGPDHPLRVVVHGHARAIRDSRPLRGEMLRFGVFRDAAVARHLVAVGAEAPNQVQLAGDTGLQRLALEALSDEQADRITPPAGGVIYEDGPAAGALRVGISSDPPNYSAELQVESAVDVRQIEHTFRIRCMPDSSSVSELLVHFSEASGQELDWEFAGRGQPAPAARRLTAGQQPAEGIRGGELWRVTLPNPRGQPFELVAKGVAPFGDEAPIPLVSLPGAAAQSGIATIRSTTAVPIAVRSQDLQAIPAPLLAPEQFGTVRGAFRYEPLEEGRLSVQRAAADRWPPAWIWSYQLASRFCPDGKAVHRAVCRIENAGAVQCEVTMPDGSQLIEASIDGRRIPLPGETVASSKLTIPLPGEVRFPTAVIDFSTQREPLRPVSTVSAPWPRTDLRVLRRTWTVWLAPGYERCDGDGTQADPAWYRRLFGPLLRDPRQSRFDPFSVDQWRLLGTVLHPAPSDPLQPSAGRFLRELARQWNRLTASSADAPPATWGELLAACGDRLDDEAGDERCRLFVDDPGLAQAGVTSQTALDASIVKSLPLPGAEDADSGWERCGAKLLQSADLVLGSHRQHLVLTSVDRGSCPQPDAASTSLRGFVGELDFGDCDSATGEPIQSRLVPLETWTASPPLPGSCWSIPRLRPRERPGLEGWTACHVSLTFSGPSDKAGSYITSLQIRQRGVVQSFGWAVFLASVGLAGWIVRGRIVLAVPVLCGSGAIALAVPAGLAAMGTGCFLGTAAAVVIVCLRSARTRRAPSPVQPDGSSVFVVLAEASCLLLAAAVVWLNATAVHAQDAASSPAAAPDRPVIHRVLFPVDEDRQPWGDNVFVPPDVFDALHRQSFSNGWAMRKWMIRAADYRVPIRWDVVGDKLSAVELVVTYRLDVLQPGVAVRLPFAAAEVDLLPDRARLDGEPAAVSWEAGDAGLSVEVDGVGEHELELAFRPKSRRDGTPDGKDSKGGFDVAIPAVVRSRLTLEAPGEVDRIEFPTAQGAVARDSQNGQYVVQLGPADRLAIQWPTEMGADSPSVVTADQLMWLDVRSSSAVLRAKFKFAALAGRIQRVQLLADPRLRILPPGPDSPILEYHIARGDVQTIWLELAPPHRQEVAFDVRFVLTETASIGNVRLPRLEAVADRTNRRWLAVSVDPNLQFTPPARTIEGSPTHEDFVAAWGQVEALPQVVTRVPDGEPNWTLATKPRAATIAVDQRLAISLGEETADWRFDAQVRVSEGSRFQYAIGVPRSAEVTSVAVLEDQAEKAARWARDERGAVIVRLDKPLAQEHQVQLRGRLPMLRMRRGRTAPQKATLRIPHIAFNDAAVKADRIELYRRPRVTVQVRSKGGLADVPDMAPGTYVPGDGRLVAALVAPPGSPKSAMVQVEVAPNRPRTTARIVVALERFQDNWIAEANCEFHSSGGVLDIVRLEIPPEWKGPFTVDADASIQTVAVPGQNRRQLLVRPIQPIEKRYQFRLRGALAAAPGERVRAPNIVPLDVARADRYLLVPTLVEDKPIAWQTSGLQAAPPPNGYQGPERKAYLCYRAVGDRVQATIEDVQPESGSPHVSLADIHADCGADGSILGVATFDLQPAGLTNCNVELPAGYEPIHVTVANLPAELERQTDGRWRLRLGPDDLPQRIQVVFRKPRDGPGRSPTVALVQAPRLVDIPVQQTLWTLQGPDAGRMEPVANDRELDPFAVELVRLQRATALTKTAVALLTKRDAGQIARWYIPWARRYAVARSRAARWLAATGNVRAAALDDLDAQQNEIAQQLNATAHRSQASSEAARAVEPADVWRVTGDRCAIAKRLAFSGWHGQIEYRYRPRPDGTVTERLIVVIALLGIAAIALLLFPHPLIAECLARYPQLVGLVLGVAWWLWLAPSPLGWGIALFSAVALSLSLIRTMARRRRTVRDPLPGEPQAS